MRRSGRSHLTACIPSACWKRHCCADFRCPYICVPRSLGYVWFSLLVASCCNIIDEAQQSSSHNPCNLLLQVNDKKAAAAEREEGKKSAAKEKASKDAEDAYWRSQGEGE